MREQIRKCCDNCIHHVWYYDRCNKWGSRTDGREVHGCFERRIRAAGIEQDAKDSTET